MADQQQHKASKKVADQNVDVMELEPVKQIEIETKNLVASSKVFIYLIIGLLGYMVFVLVPAIEEKVKWMEKDLTSVLIQSERFKKSTRVFAKDNQCASCHLSPDYLLHNLLSKYPSFSDIKAFMSVGHQRFYTMTAPLPDPELLVYIGPFHYYCR